MGLHIDCDATSKQSHLKFPIAFSDEEYKNKHQFRYVSSYPCSFVFFPETMQLKSNYIPFLPVDVSISRLCVHLPHEQREEKAHLVREKMILKWHLRRTMRLRVAGDRNAKNRAERSNIQFMKFLEWPFFSESCLGLSARTRMNGRKECNEGIFEECTGYIYLN